MKKVVLQIAISCLAVMGLGQTDRPGPAELTLTTESPSVLVGAPVVVAIQLKNASNHPLYLSTVVTPTDSEPSYGLHVTSENGVPLRRKQHSEAQSLFGRIVRQTVKEGEITQNSACVTCVYEFPDTGGRFKLYAIRTVFSDGEAVTVRSNEITITVVPKKPGASQ